MEVVDVRVLPQMNAVLSLWMKCGSWRTGSGPAVDKKLLSGAIPADSADGSTVFHKVCTTWGCERWDVCVQSFLVSCCETPRGTPKGSGKYQRLDRWRIRVVSSLT